MEAPKILWELGRFSLGVYHVMAARGVIPVGKMEGIKERCRISLTPPWQSIVQLGGRIRLPSSQPCLIR